MSPARRPSDLLAPVPALERPDLRALLLAHFYQGARIQRALRLLLVGFFVVTLLTVPPAEDQALCWVIVICYAVWSVVVGILVRLASAAAAPYVWLALFFDVLAVTAFALVADVSAERTWTAFVAVFALFVIPVLAAAQLNPWACGVVSAAAVGMHLVASVSTRHADAEPWASVLLRTGLLGVVGIGCVMLSALHRSRVTAISGLAADRARLVDELVEIEQRERSDLAEHLHDGALQYVLAARQDLEDVASDPVAAERVEHALGQAVGMLRSTLTQLHPAVVREAGLPAALADLADDIGRRSRLRVELSAESWGDTGTSGDELLLRTAQELLTNVVKHAGATHALVELGLEADGATPLAVLRVTDDGRGIDPDEEARRARIGHVGLASRRIHVEAAGGHLRLERVPPQGTRAEVRLPVVVRQ
ncbi:sensor histidine kinase [Nocardioides sp. GXQ0305]|uniref:sensor histidine kinase n=1 Tax=Nocardioides sp. GXQ0305 TaxID=3423912 RepID=UPI003D7E090E